ncbi:MAG TPA: hypothetical protein VFA06_25075 [Actinocrinis sp.]|uniref:hypothetical protein n=1 Tax=Actinocrinis sp. TaxID=1920516 RepID=UPI002D6DB764|nr:hypothetical protein [Actinocrinis sp.]HZU59177.1 hypothetical protein [Actinocrinis sp.]
MEPQNQAEPQPTQPQTQPQPTQPQTQPQTEPQPQPFSLEPAALPAMTAPIEFAPPVARRAVPRSRVLIAVGAVLSIAVGAGIGVAIVQHREDSNNKTIAAARAAAAVKPAPVTGGVRSDGSHYGSLFAYLLPMPSGYTPGPYDASYGNNSFVPAAQITSQLEDLLSGIPKSDMSSVKGALADTHLKGVAIRTMQTEQSPTAVVISVELLQFDVKDAKSAAAGFDSLVSNLNVFRNGASVPGYGQAKCVLPPGFGSDKLDEMLCVASSGDVEVVVDAQETAPLDQNSVATLVAQQLDRLKTSQSIDQ